MQTIKSAWARSRSQRSRLLAGLQTSLFYVGFLPVIATLHNLVADVTTVNGQSMYPFLNENKDSSTARDRVLNWKWRAKEGLERGMIVTFKSPENPETRAVKRIIALEGDVVKTKEHCLQSTVKVPWGHVWVEGDGEPSLDSNTYGPISKRLIVGKVPYVVWPLSKAGRIHPRADMTRLEQPTRDENFPWTGE